MFCGITFASAAPEPEPERICVIVWARRVTQKRTGFGVSLEALVRRTALIALILAQL